MWHFTSGGGGRVSSGYVKNVRANACKNLKKTNSLGKKSKRLIDRQNGKDPQVIAYADID